MVGFGSEPRKTQSNIIFPSARPRLKLFLRISLFPTYNSGIEQDLNYAKHFFFFGERKKWKGKRERRAAKVSETVFWLKEADATLFERIDESFKKVI